MYENFERRQVSACEYIFRLCHLKLRDSSRVSVFLNTRKFQQRYKVIIFDASGTAAGFCNNIFQYYENRPVEHAEYNFNGMSLAEFALLF